ncbi:tripartite tricarboxylate transporter TctB family protein [Neorhizobium alkalisoli]|uniref:Tripartite tricarboxylate transporter TctB family protein n=1 Tax=Neorhizobium alkalisoli TaxID=528178 RepID=A0A561QPF3_9HYPH|nr:tripartite tricarboxylate transporter TctB family protein [Neorhizobium alkalisoli]TWF52182.1 tripartite tricarboxylate transporter TctB family protein [Neorhizobium alkalisoli]
MNSLKFDSTNVICGLLFVLAGLFFAYQSMELALGTAFRMGPGYFPFILACALMVFGAIIIVQSARVKGEPIGALAFRGMAFILPAPIIFGLTVQGLGFVPALFISALVASFASHKMKPVTAVILSVLLTIFSVLVFSYGLGLPFQRFGQWLGY